MNKTLADAVGGARRIIGGPFGSKLTTKDYAASGIPVIRGSNMEVDGRWIGGEFAYVPRFKYERDLGSNAARAGNIIVTQRGTLGQVSIIPDDSMFAEYVVSQSQMAIDVDPKSADRDFVYYYLRSPTFVEHSHMQTIQTGVPHINLGVLRDAPADFPPLAKQREIAAALGALDDKIELNRKTAATLEEMARALYRSWFVDFDSVRARAEGRAPAHMDSATAALFPDSFGEDGLPLGWRTGTLGEVAHNPRNTVDPSAINPETPYIGLEHIPRRSIAIGDWGEADDVASAKSKMQVGQFLFGKLRPYFHKVGLVPVDGICSTDILVIEAKSALWREFVLSVISSVELVDHVNAASTGTRMPRAKWQDIAGYEIAVAPEDVIRAFSHVVAPMHARILSMAQENRTLAALRDTLLPRLMSGELRISAARELLEEVA